MDVSTKALIELQLRQLERLLDTKRVKYVDAMYIIFSDYPTVNFVKMLLTHDMSEELRKRINWELTNDI
jgi:hypothetical protein